MIVSNSENYLMAQRAVADLKCALLSTLSQYPGLSYAQVGRMLGIYTGHVGHEGHISRTLLGMLEKEGIVEQNESDKTWHLKNHGEQ